MQMVLAFPETKKACAVAGCDREGPIRRGFCGKHYRAFQLYGDPLLTWQDVKPPRVCSIDGCEKQRWARGWCSLHWQRWKKHGDPNYQPQGKVWGDVCRHPECDKPTRKNGGGRGYCAMHYGRLLRHGDLGVGSSRVMAKSWAGAACQLDDCQEPVDSLGYCNLHYLRFKRTGDPRKVRRIASLKGVACIECDRPAFSKRRCKYHYGKLNPQHAISGYMRRRARKQNARSFPYTGKQVADRMAYWGFKCWMCGGPFEAVDHVKPLAKGGLDCPANFRPACRKCNTRKHAKWYGVAGLHRFIKSY